MGQALKVLLLAAGLLAIATPALAQQDQCVDAFSEAQRLAREGRLKARKTKLIACAQASCPEIIAAKCSEWLQEAEKKQPTIVLVVRDSSGSDLVDFTVSIDGEAIAKELVGRPIEVDPGTHEIVVHAKGAELKKSVVVSEGERDRRVEIVPAGPPPPKPDPQRPNPKHPDDKAARDDRGPLARVHPLTWVGFALAIGGGVVAGVTGALALSRASELEDTCGGFTCSEAERDDYDQGVILAHVSTASVVFAGAAAALGFITLPLLYDSSDRRAHAVVGPGWVAIEGAF